MSGDTTSAAELAREDEGGSLQCRENQPVTITGRGECAVRRIDDAATEHDGIRGRAAPRHCPAAYAVAGIRGPSVAGRSNIGPSLPTFGSLCDRTWQADAMCRPVEMWQSRSTGNDVKKEHGTYD
jgi:hypothetical protein